MIGFILGVLGGLFVCAMRLGAGACLMLYWLLRSPRRASVAKATQLKTSFSLAGFMPKMTRHGSVSLDEQLDALRATMAANDATLARLRRREAILMWMLVVNLAVASAAVLALFS